MSTMRFKPTLRSVWVWSLLSIALLSVEISRIAQSELSNHWLHWPWLSTLPALVALIFGLDLLLSWQFSNLKIQRRLNHNISSGKAIQVSLSCTHQQPRAIRVRLYDHLPLHFECTELPLEITLPANKETAIHYQAMAHKRGDAQIDGIDVQAYSLLGLWYISKHIGCRNSVKVFPNFATIEGMKLLAVEHQSSQLGVQQKPRRGQGTDFQELRDYREGDTLRQIDWNATSRRQKLTSRHYQEERDQHIILMLDSGRRMMVQEGETTYFDHCLNGLLMLSYVALKQGDAVSMVSFDSARHWSSSVKGVHGITALLQRFYDLYPKPTAVDYVAAAQEVLNKGHKRSLVVLATNLREDDIDEIATCVSLLRKRHKVIVANLREASLDTIEHDPIDCMDKALTYAGLATYQEARDKLIKKLQAMKVTTLDCQPTALTSQLVSSYLAIKRAGQL